MDTPNNLYLERGGVYEERRYSPSFYYRVQKKRVQLVTEKGMPIGKAARELDIHPNLLHAWRRKFLKDGDKAFVGSGHTKPEMVEVSRLRRELKRVKERA